MSPCIECGEPIGHAPYTHCNAWRHMPPVAHCGRPRPRRCDVCGDPLSPQGECTSHSILYDHEVA